MSGRRDSVGQRRPAGRPAERVLVVIPTYNEAENVELDRRPGARRRCPSVDVLVVDDGSPGRHRRDRRQARRGTTTPVHVLHRTEKDGLGRGLPRRLRLGARAGYDVLVEMDADGSHQPEQLPRLLDALPGADLVLGSRWVPGGRVVNWPKRRELLSRGGNTYARLALGLRARRHRWLSGRSAARRSRGIDLASVASQGYCFQVDLARRTVEAGLPGRRGADHVRRAGARRVEDERRHRPRGARQGHRVGRSSTALGQAARLRGGLGRTRR